MLNQDQIEQIRKDPNNQNWFEISTNRDELSEEFIREFQNHVYWGYIVVCQKLSNPFKREFKHLINKINVEQIRKDPENQNWGSISRHKRLSIEFIREFQDYLYWDSIFRVQRLSEKSIREFIDRAYSDCYPNEFDHWWTICRYNSLSIKFIEDYSKYIKFSELNISNKTPISFIRKYKDKLNWYDISLCYRKLTEKFISEFIDYIDFQNMIKHNKYVSTEIKQFCSMFI